MIQMTSHLLRPRRRLPRHTLGALVAVFASAVAATHCSWARSATEPAQTTSVDDPRPLHEAIQILESTYGYVITYEDPPYVYKGDLKDVTQEVRRTGDPRYQNASIVVPAGGTLHFSLPSKSSMSDPAAMGSVLAQLLQSHASLQRGGRFRLAQSDDVFHVIPVEVRDVHGGWQPLKPVLDYAITVPGIANADVLDMLQAICKALNDSSAQHVLVGAVPINLMLQHRGDLQATTEPARSVLSRALATTHSRVSWSLLHDVPLRAYFLNIMPLPMPPR
jgi:hypothetical protein